MDTFQSSLTALATRARGGEASAARQFQQQLEPQLVRIVRHVLRGGKGPGPLARQIVATADDIRAVGDPRVRADLDTLAQQVARRMCDSACSRMQPGPVGERAARETVRF